MPILHLFFLFLSISLTVSAPSDSSCLNYTLSQTPSYPKSSRPVFYNSYPKDFWQSTTSSDYEIYATFLKSVMPSFPTLTPSPNLAYQVNCSQITGYMYGWGFNLSRFSGKLNYNEKYVQNISADYIVDYFGIKNSTEVATLSGQVNSSLESEGLNYLLFDKEVAMWEAFAVNYTNKNTSLGAKLTLFALYHIFGPDRSDFWNLISTNTKNWVSILSYLRTVITSLAASSPFKTALVHSRNLLAKTLRPACSKKQKYNLLIMLDTQSYADTSITGAYEILKKIAQSLPLGKTASYASLVLTPDTANSTNYTLAANWTVQQDDLYLANGKKDSFVTISGLGNFKSQLLAYLQDSTIPKALLYVHSGQNVTNTSHYYQFINSSSLSTYFSDYSPFLLFTDSPSNDLLQQASVNQNNMLVWMASDKKQDEKKQATNLVNGFCELPLVANQKLSVDVSAGDLEFLAVKIGLLSKGDQKVVFAIDKNSISAATYSSFNSSNVTIYYSLEYPNPSENFSDGVAKLKQTDNLTLLLQLPKASDTSTDTEKVYAGVISPIDMSVTVSYTEPETSSSSSSFFSGISGWKIAFMVIFAVVIVIALIMFLVCCIKRCKQGIEYDRKAPLFKEPLTGKEMQELNKN